ncbi:hypothetical protein [Ascidiimonas sp. W6]|uniref:hypothetical protein n=1 Tax=Ascidiimonas meishanensis TaxID=3128903 RepID=UPI0030EF2DF8
MLAREIKDQLIQEMKSIKDKEGAIDGRVHGFIDRDKQISYTMDLFNNQADQDIETYRQEFSRNINAWINSSSSRARMVITEATENNISSLAKATFNASPLERVVIAGLDSEKQELLKKELQKLWKDRLENSEFAEDNKEQFKKIFGSQDTQYIDLNQLIEERSLEELLGPHLFKSDLDVGFETMQKEFPQFEVNIEEVLCFGDSNELVEKLGELGKNIQAGVPVFSVKATPFQDNDEGLWKCACKDAEAFIAQITSGKSAPELIGSSNETGYDNITISPTFQNLFTIDGMQQEMRNQEFSSADEVAQKDLDFFKQILFDEALYPAGTSPEAITKTISKATSKLGAMKATKVSQALKWNMVNRPVSSAVEVEFAIGGMTLDGGNDLIKENLDKKNSYKLFFEDLLQTLVENSIEKEQAVKIAFAETVNAYTAIEKHNKSIRELVHGETGAEAWRDLGLESTNRVKEANSLGIKFLRPLMPLFLTGAAIGIVGLALTGVGLPAAVGLGLGIAGLGGSALGTTATAISMYFQIKANKKHLPRANTAFAEANAKMFYAQRERDTQVVVALNKIKEKLKSNGIDGLREQNRQNQIQLIQENLPTGNRVTRSAKRKMLNKMSSMEMEDDVKLDGRVPEGKINRGAQLGYTMDLFVNQANRAKISSNEEYKMDINAWINSYSNRARLVILEASETNIKQLAKVTFNASPLERVVVAGLDSDAKQEALKTELQELWKERLAKSQENQKQFEKTFRTEANQEMNIDELIEERTLPELLGPHLAKTDLDTSYETMRENFGEFDVNIEEVLCFGNSTELVQNLGELGQKIQSGVPVFSVKADPFHEHDQGLWKCACKDSSEFLEGITSGKSAPELIGEEEGIGYKNITLSPTFQQLFEINGFKEKMDDPTNPLSNDIDQKDLDFFRKILFEEALYPANTSPKAITKTISKATSKLGAMAGTKVADSLKWNLVERPVSAAVEVQFAISSMTLDGGNDLVKEDLDKKNSYKGFFEDLRDSLIKQGTLSETEATKTAFIETVKTYTKVEKNNETIKELIRGTSGANNWRDLGLETSNKTRKVTKTGVRALKPLMGLFLMGTALGVAGLATTVVGIPLAIGLGMGVLGMAGSVAGLLATGISTVKLSKANKKYLPIANFAFAQANSKMFKAQRERVTQTAKELTEVKERFGITNTEEKVVQPVLNVTRGVDIDLSAKVALSSPSFDFEPKISVNTSGVSLVDLSKEFKNSSLYNSQVGTYILANLPENAKTEMPEDQLNDTIKELFIDFHLKSCDQEMADLARNDEKMKQLIKDPDMGIDHLTFLSVLFAESNIDMNKLLTNLDKESFSKLTPKDIKTLLIPKNKHRERLTMFDRFGRAVEKAKKMPRTLGRFLEPLNRQKSRPIPALGITDSFKAEVRNLPNFETKEDKKKPLRRTKSF